MSIFFKEKEAAAYKTHVLLTWVDEPSCHPEGNKLHRFIYYVQLQHVFNWTGPTTVLCHGVPASKDILSL